MIRAAMVGAAFAGTLHAEGLLATGEVKIVGAVTTSEAPRASFIGRFGGTTQPRARRSSDG